MIEDLHDTNMQKNKCGLKDYKMLHVSLLDRKINDAIIPRQTRRRILSKNFIDKYIDRHDFIFMQMVSNRLRLVLSRELLTQ